MVSDCKRGLIFCIILKSPVDKYDILPDIMKTQRTDIDFWEKGRIDLQQVSNILCIVGQDQSEERMQKTEYFTKGDSDISFREMQRRFYTECESSYQTSLQTVETTKISNMKLTDSEETLKEFVINHQLVKDNMNTDFPPAWYDQYYWYC